MKKSFKNIFWFYQKSLFEFIDPRSFKAFYLTLIRSVLNYYIALSFRAHIILRYLESENQLKESKAVQSHFLRHVIIKLHLPLEPYNYKNIRLHCLHWLPDVKRWLYNFSYKWVETWVVIITLFMYLYYIHMYLTDAVNIAINWINDKPNVRHVWAVISSYNISYIIEL